MGKASHWTGPEGVALMAAWTREGCSFAEVARRCGVRETVLRGWARRCPGVEEALSASREAVDAQVEAALLRRALDTRIPRPWRRRAAAASSAAKRINMSRPTSPPSSSGFPAACRRSGARAWRGGRAGQTQRPAGGAGRAGGRGGSPLKDQKGGGHAAQPQAEALLERGELPLERQVRSHALGQDVSGLFRHPPPPARAGGQAGAGGASGNTRGTLERNVLAPMREIYGAQMVSPLRADGTATLFASASTVWARTTSGMWTACAARPSSTATATRWSPGSARCLRCSRAVWTRSIPALTAPATPPGRGTGSRSSSIRTRTSFPSSTASTTTPFCRRACARR